MKSICHFSNEEQQHFILCHCGEYVDMRNLSEVFLHQHANLPQPEWTHSMKKEEPAIYLPSGKKIGLN